MKRSERLFQLFNSRMEWKKSNEKIFRNYKWKFRTFQETWKHLLSIIEDKHFMITNKGMTILESLQRQQKLYHNKRSCPVFTVHISLYHRHAEKTRPIKNWNLSSDISRNSISKWTLWIKFWMLWNQWIGQYKSI